MIDKNISVIIEIPKEFYINDATGRSQNLTITSLDDFENAAYLKVYINSYLSSIETLSTGAEGNQQVFDELLQDYDRNSIALTQSEAVVIDTKVYADLAGFRNSIGFSLTIAEMITSKNHLGN